MVQCLKSVNTSFFVARVGVRTLRSSNVTSVNSDRMRDEFLSNCTVGTTIWSLSSSQCRPYDRPPNIHFLRMCAIDPLEIDRQVRAYVARPNQTMLDMTLCSLHHRIVVLIATRLEYNIGWRRTRAPVIPVAVPPVAFSGGPGVRTGRLFCHVFDYFLTTFLGQNAFLMEGLRIMCQEVRRRNIPRHSTTFSTLLFPRILGAIRIKTLSTHPSDVVSFPHSPVGPQPILGA